MVTTLLELRNVSEIMTLETSFISGLVIFSILQILVLGIFRSEILVLMLAMLVLGPGVLVTQIFILKMLILIVSVLLSTLECTYNLFEV